MDGNGKFNIFSILGLTCQNKTPGIRPWIGLMGEKGNLKKK
jgi:hypothetical protein